MSLLIKAGNGHGFSFGVRAWTEMGSWCAKRMCRSRKWKNLGFKGVITLALIVVIDSHGYKCCFHEDVHIAWGFTSTQIKFHLLFRFPYTVSICLDLVQKWPVPCLSLAMGNCLSSSGKFKRCSQIVSGADIQRAGWGEILKGEGSCVPVPLHPLVLTPVFVCYCFQIQIRRQTRLSLQIWFVYEHRCCAC